MNKKIKNRWVDALRSGDYKQGKGELRTPAGKYCCLGVLTDLYVKAKKEEFSDVVGPHVTLPEQVRMWAGLDSHDPEIKNVCLSSWNDDEGKRFTGIAILIEKHL